ncbi:MAG: ribonuclease III [Gammaproteobacteria bacterium]|nr:ribonuclease III [Gammaproteobacteria bacterium]
MIQSARWALRHLDYRFNSPELLELALTHKSSAAKNNERLEFLGDAVLGCAVADALFRQEGGADEGTLSRMRALLVRRETLAELASAMALGEQLRLGSGEMQSGGHRRASILADALEAVIGAVFLDGGFAAAQALVQRIYATKLLELPAPDSLKDPKTLLQEKLQAEAVGIPEYAVASETGPDHNRRFVVECRIAERNLLTRGKGVSRRRAEQAAAAAALQALDGEVPGAP